MEPGEEVTLNPQPLPPRTIWLTALVAIALAAILAAWGTFSGDEDSGFGDYWPVLVIIGVLAAVVYLWAVPRAARGAWSMAKTGIVLSVLGLVTVVVFWSGAPPIFAFAGILLGYYGRRGAEPGLATAALALGVLALVADIAIYIGDQAS